MDTLTFSPPPQVEWAEGEEVWEGEGQKKKKRKKRREKEKRKEGKIEESTGKKSRREVSVPSANGYSRDVGRHSQGLKFLYL